MKILFLSVLLMMILSSLCQAQSANISFQKLSFIIAASNYGRLDDLEKMKTLQQLVSVLKSFDHVLYNDIYQGLYSLRSITKNSISFLSSQKCEMKPGNFSNGREKDLNSYLCKNLVNNAMKRYQSIENELNRYVLPLIGEFEAEMTKVYKIQGGNEVLAPFKKVMQDLKGRIARIKLVKQFFYSSDFKSADREINSILLLLGVQYETSHHARINSRIH